MGGALTRYRVIAWIVGVALVVLVLIGMPLKYGFDNPSVVGVVGVAHGWLYMLYLALTFDLSRRAELAAEADAAGDARRHRAVRLVLRRAAGEPVGGGRAAAAYPGAGRGLSAAHRGGRHGSAGGGSAQPPMRAASRARRSARLT